MDVEQAGRYGADVATVGAMVQLVTRGILLDTMRVDTSDEEIDIRVRLPEENRVLSTRSLNADSLLPHVNGNSVRIDDMRLLRSKLKRRFVVRAANVWFALPPPRWSSRPLKTSSCL